MIDTIVNHYLPIAGVFVAIIGLFLSDRRNRFMVEKSRRDTDKAITSLQEQVNHITGRVGRLHKACETLEQETFKNSRASERAESKIDTAIQWIKLLVNILAKGKKDG
jgi:hypothetical protein